MKTGNLETVKRLKRPIKRTKIAFKRVFLKTVIDYLVNCFPTFLLWRENICLYNRGQRSSLVAHGL